MFWVFVGFGIHGIFVFGVFGIFGFAFFGILGFGLLREKGCCVF